MSYYQGDYYRGDPFSLGSLVSGIAKVAGGFLAGGPIGAAAVGASMITGAVTGKPSVSGVPSTPSGGQLVNITPMVPPPVAMPGGAVQPMQAGITGTIPQQPGIGIGGTRIIPGNLLPGGSPGIVPNVTTPLKGYHINKAALKGKAFKKYLVKNQRMNVANSRALRRAIRRGRGFVKLARRAAGAFGFKVVGKGHGTRRGHAFGRKR